MGTPAATISAVVTASTVEPASSTESASASTMAATATSRPRQCAPCSHHGESSNEGDDLTFG